ncbi:MAG: amidohydrolase family protein [Bacteroidota bacterium]
MKKALIGLMLCLFSYAQLSAQSKKDNKEWDVSNPPGKFTTAKFSASEGTWMNLDVSPDGQTIVFDLLGDIYSLPMAGGKATVLRQGLPWEVQPRFSPDGQRILFTSDAGGGDNLWTMKADGSDAKAMTKEKFRLLNNGVWMPDGEYVLARKHFTSTRSLGAGELWMYHTSGGDGIQITKRKNDQQDLNEPSISPDGRYIYYSEDLYPGGYFQYNKDPNKQIYAIQRYDREKGTTEKIITGPGGAMRPELSNDGKKLAFVRRIRTQSILFVADLETGEEFRLFDGLTKDQQEAWAIFGVYTGFDWTPDDKHIIIWGKGKLWKVNAKTGKATNIPFTAEVEHRLAETVQFKNQVNANDFKVRAIRQAITSPDGQQLVFNALGYLWKKQLPNGKPERLSQQTDVFEFEPAFSPDGKQLVYVSWEDEKMGHIHLMNLANGQSKQLTTRKAIYRTPNFSPDGQMICFRKEGGNVHQGYTHNRRPGIYTMKIDGSAEQLVSPQGEHPRFTKDGKRLFIQTGGYLFGSLTKSLKSVKLDGSDEKTLLNTKYANQFVPSPDNRWIAFSELFKVYVAPMPQTGKPLGLSSKTKAVPVAQVARDAGINLHWSADSKSIHWTLGEEYFSSPLNDRFSFLEGAKDSLPPVDTVGLSIGLTTKVDKPKGIVAFTNATIITMEGDEVLDKATLVVEGEKIMAIGPSGTTKIPKSAKIIDCTGKTIMPGLIDVHAHLGAFRYGLSPQKHWQYFANLAYGITTTHDPSSNTEITFAQSEMVRSGQMIGPRIYSTGTILYGADGDFKAVINSLEDARSAIRRTKAFGAFSVKSYNQPRRDQRQQVIQAARELGIMVYPEGGSFFYHNMSMVADGHTGVEHNIPVAPLHEDVLKFWSATKTANTPTLIVAYGAVQGEYYWYQNTDVWEKERQLTFMPQALLDARARHRTMVPEEEYKNGYMLISESCKKLQDAGVNINLGAHGQLNGLGAHWELWMLQQGGMSNLQALRSATLNGAEYIGMADEIGSLKKGKLADLIVLDKNPIDDIRNTELVRYTMINGRLYDAATMNEIGNYDKPRSKFYWELEGSGNGYPVHGEMGSLTAPRCLCGQ